MLARINILPLLVFTTLLFSCKGKMYRAPGNSMANTIRQGEVFYVKKTKSINRNDIVVFDMFGPDYSTFDPETKTWQNSWQKRYYRAVAMSGDVVQLAELELLVNNKPVPLPPSAVRAYGIYSKVPIDDYLDEKDKEFLQLERAGDTIIYKVSISKEDALRYKQEIQEIIHVSTVKPDYYTGADSEYARPSAAAHWNSVNYGPLKIPSPGDTVFVSGENHKMYQHIPGIKEGQNIITEKLYFLLGDNRLGAQDSRFIGFIPQSAVYGVVK